MELADTARAPAPSTPPLLPASAHPPLPRAELELTSHTDDPSPADVDAPAPPQEGSKLDKGKGVDRSGSDEPALEDGVAALALGAEPLADEAAALVPDAGPTKEPEEEWPLKTIPWPPLPPPPSEADYSNELNEALTSVRVITQNSNGPCSLIALCNVLILRGDVQVTPPNRNSVSYSYLAALVADYLIRSNINSTRRPESFEASLSEALSILPSTRYGLNLNPRFGSIDGFRSSGSVTVAGELALFQLAKVPLLHGWVVDPQDEEAWDLMVETCGDYDTAVEAIVEGDVLGGDQDFTYANEEEMIRAIEKRSQWTPVEEEKVRNAHMIRRFLEGSRTQLTYHGLFLLSSHLAPSSLSALFRNNHLSVIFRRPTLPDLGRTPPGPQLFTLVTDSTFAQEPDVVWESLEDVDGGASEFFDGTLRASHVRGGDWVGRERRTARRVEEAPQPASPPLDRTEDADFALAQQLQNEEDHYSQQQQQQHYDRRDRERGRRPDAAPAVLTPGERTATTVPVSRRDPHDDSYGRDGRDARNERHQREGRERRERQDGRDLHDGRDEGRGRGKEKKGDKCLVM